MEETTRTATPASFLKRHGFVIAAVALPLVVVAAFALVRMLPRMMVEDPRHELVYSVVTAYASQPTNLSCVVIPVDGRLCARWSRSKDPVYSATSRVYRLDPATGALHELPTPEPANRDALEGTQDVYFTGLDGVRIETSLRAPDGYEFENTYAGGSGIFGGLFFDHSRGPRARIKKDGRVIMVPRPNESAYGYEEVSFIGWLIPSEAGR